MKDLSLKSFTSVDAVNDIQTYFSALIAFDEIEQLQELKQIARQLIAPGSATLDVGCGFGLETLRLAHLVGPLGRMMGIDKSADFIEEAQRRAAAAGLAITFDVGDAMALPYPDGSFDNVRAERLLIYLEAPDRALAEMKRVAKRGGSLAVIEPDFGTTTINLPSRSAVRRAMAHEADTAVVQSWLPGQLGAMLNDLGFEDIQTAPEWSFFHRSSPPSIFPMSVVTPRRTVRSRATSSMNGSPRSNICVSRGGCSAPSTTFSSLRKSAESTAEQVSPRLTATPRARFPRDR